MFLTKNNNVDEASYGRNAISISFKKYVIILLGPKLSVLQQLQSGRRQRLANDVLSATAAAASPASSPADDHRRR